MPRYLCPRSLRTPLGTTQCGGDVTPCPAMPFEAMLYGTACHIQHARPQNRGLNVLFLAKPTRTGHPPCASSTTSVRQTDNTKKVRSLIQQQVFCGPIGRKTR